MRFESRRGPKRKKKEKKKVLKVGKLIYLLVIFSLLIFLCTSKIISRTSNNIAITF
jgi:hypothetical protein